MNDRTADRPIVEKIRKLLALADSNKNSHEHEREVAMQAAMDLLAKHNLSMAQIDGASLEILPDEVHLDIKLEPWLRDIFSAACRLYFTCYYMRVTRNWQGRKEHTPVFIGTTENVAVTIDIASWLIKSVRAESNRLYHSQYERRSFRVGAAERILRRASEIREVELATAVKTPGNQLMVIRNHFDEANQKHMRAKNCKTFRSRPLYLDEGAYTDGESFGQQVGLNRQVDAGAKHRS